MAIGRIREDNPTLSSVALDLSNQGGLGMVRPEEVAYAARLRNVETKDGRIPRDSLADVYFGLRNLRGLDD